MRIERLVVSPRHAYEGRPSDGPLPVGASSPSSIELRAGFGVVGDRYAGRAAHRDAASPSLARWPSPSASADPGVARGSPHARQMIMSSATSRPVALVMIICLVRR